VSPYIVILTCHRIDSSTARRATLVALRSTSVTVLPIFITPREYHDLVAQHQLSGI